MAGDDKGSKTEAPTQFKLKKAREQGQVPQSKDLSSTLVFVAGIICSFVFFKYMSDRVYQMLYTNVVDFNFNLVGPSLINQIFINFGVDFALIMIPFLLVVFLVGFISHSSQVGFHISFKPLEPNISKLNPVEGFKRLISVRGLVNTLIAVIKMVAIYFIASSVLWDETNSIALINLNSFKAIFSKSNSLLVEILFKSMMALLIMSIIDFTYQRWQFTEDQKMTKQEVKDEFKTREGNPQIKSKVRQIARERATKRGLKESVAEADVVIANPFHIAVAIKYDRSSIVSAPIIVAMGARLLAQRIKDFARDSNVEIVVNVPLARAIYKDGKVGQEISPDLYVAVAEILARIFKKRAKQK